MIEMKPELLAALNASFDAGGWRATGVNVDRHETSTPGNPSADPPVESTSVATVTAVITAEHAERQTILVFILTGDDDGFTSVKLMAGGGSFETDDETLIGRLAATIEPATDDMQAALLASLQAA